MEFNEAQLSAVNHFSGPCLTLAGPGSGKTTVLTHRILSLIEKNNVSAENILVITFTRMAAQEMKERFFKISENRYSNVTFGTFHSVFFSIIKRIYCYNASNIISDKEKFSFFNGITDNLKMEITDYEEFTKKVMTVIDKQKIRDMYLELGIADKCPLSYSKEVLMNETEGICQYKDFLYIYNEYIQFIKKNNYIDFNDMQLLCLELFMKRKDVLLECQEKFRYILIDEFQDISRIQYDIVILLAEKYRNIFIVGDDDQSIYGFRGAKPDYMRMFEEEFEHVKRIQLCINYRCSNDIVMGAKSLIEHNKNRFLKDISAFKDQSDKINKSINKAIFVKELNDETLQSEFVSEMIKNNCKTIGSFDNIAVLVRTNGGASLIVQDFVRKNIPFYVKEKIDNIFNHQIARDFINYINIAMGKKDRKFFLGIINRPIRYFSRNAFEEEIIDFKKVRKFYFDKKDMLKRVDDFENDLEIISNMTPFAAINYIRHAIGYDIFIESQAKKLKQETDTLIEIANQIQESSKGFRSFSEWLDYIEKYTEELKLQIEKNKHSQIDKKGVCICTMHASKGLEFNTVFVIDVNEGIIPYHKAVSEQEKEEERRMFYVAMTRAKNNLYLCYVNNRYNKKVFKSEFLDEIDKRYAVYL